MSDINKLTELVDNGLKIAEFIQENRSKENPTYGRSAISTPSTADRTAAWELFLHETSGDSTGQERATQSKDGATKDEGTIPKIGVTEVLRDVSNSEGAVSETNESRDNHSWDATNSSQSDGLRTPIHLQDSSLADRGWDIVSIGVDEPSKSYKSNGKTTGTDRGARPKAISSTDGEGIEGRGGAERKTIKETTPDDLDAIMEETAPKPKRRLRNNVKIKETIEEIPPRESAVKKTTEKSSGSLLLEKRQPSGAGATQDVRQLPNTHLSNNADVENVLSDASTVKKT
ncbi:V protein [Hipposideros bat paramyxovirus]|nr:V protein [Hipposideros bat paramyxovirus]